MFTFKIKGFLLLLIILNLSGCDENNKNDDLNSSLTGTWYYLTESDEGNDEYYGEHIISQNGNDVKISHCNGFSTELEIEGDKLFYENGNQYHLSVIDTETLSGYGDSGETSTVKKLSNKDIFNDGSFNLASHIIEDLEKGTNVCATIRGGRFGSPGLDGINTQSLQVKSDYQDGYIFLSVTFKEIQTGAYEVVDVYNFIDSQIDTVFINLDSMKFESFLGEGFGLRIVSGTINVESIDETGFRVSGVLISKEGYEFEFSTFVDISVPENSQQAVQSGQNSWLASRRSLL